MVASVSFIASPPQSQTESSKISTNKIVKPKTLTTNNETPREYYFLLYKY